MRTPRDNHRRGSAYVLILGAAMIVTMLGVGGVLATTSARKSARLDSEGSSLRRAAAGALRAVAGNAQNTIAWRSGAQATPPLSLAVDGVSLSVAAADPNDANLANDLAGKVSIVASATKGQARQVVSIVLQPDTTPMDALVGPLHAGGGISVTGSGNITSDTRISSNGAITASTGTIRADVAAVGALSGTITGTKTTLATALTMPTGLEARYEALGTTISLSAFSGRKIDKGVLGPGRNPFGSTNPLGIYVIDCAGNDFEVRDSRLNCTLVLKNCSSLTLTNSIQWTTPSANWPLIITSGPIYANISAANLSEFSTSTNFNPSGMPYLGSTDTDKTDSYPAYLLGTIYAGGDLTVDSGILTLEGAMIVAGQVKLIGTGAIRLRYRCDSAPPGFAKREYVVDTSSFARVVY